MAKRLLAITVILLAALADWAQCPDFTDLTAPGVICQYGTFVNPFQYTGIAVNRHTVITQQGTDPSTNFNASGMCYILHSDKFFTTDQWEALMTLNPTDQPDNETF